MYTRTHVYYNKQSWYETNKLKPIEKRNFLQHVLMASVWNQIGSSNRLDRLGTVHVTWLLNPFL